MARDEKRHDTTAEGRVAARQDLLETVFDLWASQAETLRLADHWSRYEARLRDAAIAAEAAMASLIDDPRAAIEAGLEALKKEESLSEDQRQEALQRGFRAAVKAAKSADEKPNGRTEAALLKVLERREDLGLLSSQLVSLVADFELFVLRVMTVWLELDPSYISERKLEFTFEEMLARDSIEEIREAEIHQFLEQHMRKSATDWFKEFRKMLSATKLEGAEDFTLLEVFQRRHIVVHHGGLVSRQYLKNLSAHTHNAELGDHLSINLEYVRRAADCLAITAHSIVVTALFAAAKTEDEKRNVEEEVGELTFQLLNQDRDAVVVRFIQSFDLNRIKREFSRSQMQVNGWIALSRQGRFSEVEAKIRGWDVDAKDNRFKVARLALLSDIEGVAALLMPMLRSGEISLTAIETWPLFDPMRLELWDELIRIQRKESDLQ